MANQTTLTTKENLTTSTRKARVVALVPAHNEQFTIGLTIESLMAQTYPLSYILIIADNCSDQTVRVARRYQKKYGPRKLRILKTTNNYHKKAGALNQGFKYITNKPDFVFGMDADTIVHPGIIEAGVKQLQAEPETAGICSAYRTLPLKDGAGLWPKFLWRLQNIEFGLANAWRVENYKNARVLPGVAVIFRVKALKEISKLNKGIIWATDSLVEDYRLTLELKDLGWAVKSSLNMISWSDVPLKITGKGGLFDQRQRWYSGTIDEIRRRGFRQRHSRYETFTIVLLVLNLLMRSLLYGTYAVVIASGQIMHLASYFLLLPLLAALLQFYRWVKYSDQRDKWQGLMTITLIPNEVYAIFKEITYTYSVWLSYYRPDRAW